MSTDASDSGMAHHLCAIPITSTRANYVNNVTTNIGLLGTYTRAVDHRQGKHSYAKKIKTCVQNLMSTFTSSELEAEVRCTEAWRQAVRAKTSERDTLIKQRDQRAE